MKRKMNNSKIEILRKLAKSWNNQDICFIEEYIAENVIYYSQWTLIPLVGKLKLICYLNSKFIAIKQAIKFGTISVFAEMASFETGFAIREPCLVLTQKMNETVRQVSILIELKIDKIERIDVCFIPDPLEAILTGEIPK